jgi:hypothetical protein
MQLPKAREFFSQQAIDLSNDGSFIRSYVLDSSLLIGPGIFDPH